VGTVTDEFVSGTGTLLRDHDRLVKHTIPVPPALAILDEANFAFFNFSAYNIRTLTRPIPSGPSLMMWVHAEPSKENVP
jgi:hypothetical protein